MPRKKADKRVIYLGRSVENEDRSLEELTVGDLEDAAKQFSTLEAQNKEPILIEFGYVRGGNLAAGLRLGELILASSVHVVGYAHSFLGSVGPYIYLSCKRRIASPKVEMWLYPPSFTLREGDLDEGGKVSEDLLRVVRSLKKKSEVVLYRRTKLAPSRIRYILSLKKGHETFGAARCKRFRFVHQIGELSVAEKFCCS